MNSDNAKNSNPLPDDLMGEFLESAKPKQPDPERAAAMLASVKSRLQDNEQLPLQELVTIPAGGEWFEAFPGNKIKMLRDDPDTQSFLVRLDPGTRFPAHSHPKDEETLVLEGDCSFGDIPLTQGDYHLARAGSQHAETFTNNGCLLFIRCGTEQNQ